MKKTKILILTCALAAFLSTVLIRYNNRDVFLIIPNNFVGLISIKEDKNSLRPNPKALDTSNVYEYILAISNNTSTVRNLQHLLRAKAITASYEWVEPVDCKVIKTTNNEVLIDIKRL